MTDLDAIRERTETDWVTDPESCVSSLAQDLMQARLDRRDLLAAFRTAPVDDETRAALDQAQLKIDTADAVEAGRAALAGGDVADVVEAMFQASAVQRRFNHTTTEESGHAE